jgi:hypothetical protein
VLSLLFSHPQSSRPAGGVAASPPVAYAHVSEYAPFFEIDPHWDGDQLVPWIREHHARIGRRVFNTHLRFDMLPSSAGEGGGKFIYIVRSPLDACVSFYHHLSHQVEGGFAGDFDEFFRDWLKGEIAFGTWDDHVLSYVTAFASGHDKIVKLDDGREFLLLTYEEMIEDLPKVVDSIVDFLELDVPSQRRRDLLPTFSFAHMKANIDRFQPKSVSWKNQFSFLRHGRPGDGHSNVTEEQRLVFSRRVKERFEPILLEKLNKTNMTVLQNIESLLGS